MPTLTDSARVDGLCELASLYLEDWFSLRKNQAIAPTVDDALQIAKRIGYLHGLAVASYLKGAFIVGTKSDYPLAKQYFHESLGWFSLTPNKKKLGQVFGGLGYTKVQEGNYDEALDTLEIGCREALKSDGCGLELCLETMTDIYRERGEYIKLLQTQQRLVVLDRQMGDTSDYSFHEAWVLGLMYRLLGEYRAAVPFWRKVFIGYMGGNIGAWNTMEYAELMLYAGELDSARYYYARFNSLHSDRRDLRYFLVSKGEYFAYLKQFAASLPYLRRGLELHRQFNDRRQMNRVVLDLAATYSALGENDSALHYARQGLAMALHTKAKPLIRDAYGILYSVFDRLQQRDSAFVYYRAYIAEKEAVLDDQTKGKMAAFNYEHQIHSLAKEKQSQQAEIARASFQKKVLALAICAVLLLSIFILRSIVLKRRNEQQLRKIAEQQLQVQKLEMEQSRSELQQRATELEMQALRAQMNPHFIFNSLNSINRFILQNDKLQASGYLTKFSRLVRLILQNSQQPFVPLESEIEALQLYLELEALRFDDHFIYCIEVDEDLDATSIKVPPLIIQPYVENAIWHGLMHKEERGHLSIEITDTESRLICKITDDGVGRKKAAEMKNKTASLHKSVGLRITADRIAMLHQEDVTDVVTVHDLVLPDGSPGGTEVLLKIPLLQE